MLDTPCVIFAGGKSSRMGTDKALLPFGNFPTLTQFQYERLKKIFSNLYISCKSADKFDFEANFIEDIVSDEVFAPTAGFISMFEYLDAKQIFVLSVDTPFIQLEQIEAILSHKGDGYDAVIAQTPDQTHPMCGLYSRTLHVRFQNMLQNNEHKLGMLLKSVSTLHINFTQEDPFYNINYMDEYEKALSNTPRKV